MASRTRRKPPAKKAEPPHPWRRRLSRLVKTAVAGVALCAVVFGIGWVITPSAAVAPELALSQATEHRIAYPGAPVPQNFARALIATEDHRYDSVPGVDPFAMIRVMAGKISGHPDQGGATIEQQLAKMLYTPGKSSGWTAEAEQVMLAIKLNITYSKPQVLQMYSEVAYYGHGYYGLRKASCGYFGREPSALSVTQAAMLAGVVNAPSADDPVLHPAAARARFEHVVGRMVAVRYLTVAQAARVLNSPLALVSVPGCR